MGLSMKNTVIVTSGEHGRVGRTLADVAATGVGAVTTKTIIPFPVPDPLPCYALVPNGFLDCVLAAGADVIELPTHCPHLAENLEAQFPGMNVPPPGIDNPGPFGVTV